MEDVITDAIRKIVREEVRSAIRQEVEQSLGRLKGEVASACSCIPESMNGYEATWTTRQTAAFLGIAMSTLYNMISLGKFPRPRKQGRRNAFIPSEVAQIRREWLNLDT